MEAVFDQLKRSCKTNSESWLGSQMIRETLRVNDRSEDSILFRHFPR